MSISPTRDEYEQELKDAYGESILEYKKNDRVVTENHGAGTVLGPEFYKNPETYRTQWLQRWAVKLDNPPKWYTQGIAYYWSRNLRKEF